MELPNAGWFRAIGVAVLGIACSAEPEMANNGATAAGVGSSGIGGAAASPTTGAGVSGGQGTAGMMAVAGTGSGMAGTSGAGGTTASGAGGAAAGTSAGGSGAGGMAGAGGAAEPAVPCDPADKTPEPTQAPFTDIPGYDRLSMVPTTGPLEPVLEEDPGMPEWTVYRPATLGGESKHPVLIWANGGCLTNGTLYGQWLLELASHGFIAIADGAPQAAGASPSAGGQRAGGGGEPMTMAIDWIAEESERPCSQYYQKVDVTKVAVAGQSCGGIMAMEAAGDERVTTSVICNSGLFAADQSIYSALHSPIAFLIGGSSDIAFSNAERDVMNINDVPVFYGNLAVGHGGTWGQTNAGEMGRVGLGWLNWHLKGDAAAEKMFVGPDCELCDSEWVVEKKMID